jgi:integrase
MAQVYRPVYTHTDPVTGKKSKRKSKTWHVRYWTPAGERVRVKGYRDRRATEALAVNLERREARLAEGLADPMDEHAKKPLADHLADYIGYQRAKGNTGDHVALTEARIRACLDGCRFIKISDVQPSAVVGFLAELRGRGKSIATANYYLTAVKGFTRWLWKDKRTATDPLAGLSKLANAETDVRHPRRMLAPEELRKVLITARASDTAIRYIAGEDRFMLYAVAAGTGFRAKELHSLTPASFDLDGTPAMVRVESGYTKNRKEVLQPIPPDLAEILRGYLAAKPADQPVWPGKWYRHGAEILRHDLEAAGIPYETEEGFADFHSLRHDFVSMVAQSGASAKTVQTLARHSTVQLTLGRYAHAGLFDLAAAVSDLPSILPGECPSNSNLDALRATGTDGPAGCPGRRGHETVTGPKNLSPPLGPQPAKTGDFQRQTEAQLPPVDSALSSSDSSGNHGESRVLMGTAEGGTRTHTSLRTPDFESGASADSATSAAIFTVRLLR